AQGVAKGLRHAEAYREAGYAANPAASSVNATRLLKNPTVAARVAELRSAAAKALIAANVEREELAEVSVRTVTAMLVADRNLARENRQAAAAVAATHAIAKLHGLLIDRSEARIEHVDNRTAEEMIEDIMRKLALLAERQAAEPADGT